LAQTDKKIIRAKGAHTLANAVQKAANVYMKQNPDVMIVSSGGGSTTGIDSWLQKEVHVALCVRQLNEKEINEAKEAGIQPVKRLVSHDGVAIVVNRANPVSELTVAEVEKIFSGEYGNWRDVGGNNASIQVWISDPKMHGTPGFIQKAFLGGKPFSKDAKIHDKYRRLIHEVSRDKNAVAFSLTQKSLEAQRDGEIKIVSMKESVDAPAIEMTWENIRNMSYPLRRPNYFYWDASAADTAKEIAKFADFCVKTGLDLSH
jgi:phosphate transport system substrate-binding protein